MKFSVFPLVSALAISVFVPTLEAASANDVYPIPQRIKAAGKQTIPATSISAPAAKKYPAIATACKATKSTPSGNVKITLDKDGAKLKSKLKAAKVSDIPTGAYWLNISANGIEISAADAAGEFYASQTIAQMIEIDGKVACGEILDWPDIGFRGTVEGYYGDPWSTDARKYQFQMYGKYKLNTYVYGPKDDPYHRNKWRENYPKAEADGLRELVKVAAENHVNFVWTLHLGGIFNENNRPGEYKALLSKLEFMYGLGIRSFGVFFDDFGKADAPLQSEICNYIVENFLKKKKDCTPLVMCPSQYNRGWTNGNYLDVLGEKLDPSVNVMWTGNSVCSNITEECTDWVNKRLRRKAFIWWNWPVTDYCKTALTMGRTYGLENNVRGKISGMTLNPMDKADASLIGILGAGIWAWNVEKFDSVKVWKDLIKRTYPTCASAMQTFSDHNSDQGENVHGYRREESVEFLPTLNAATSEYNSSKKFSAGTKKALVEEFTKMEKAGKELTATLPKSHPRLYHEIEYWVKAFAMLGRAGNGVVKMTEAGTPEKKFEAAETVVRALDKIDEASAGNVERNAKYRSGVKTGGTHVMPFIQTVFKKEWDQLYKQVGGSSGGSSGPALYKAFSNVPSLKNVQAERDGKEVKINVLEQITLAPKQYLGIELPEGIYGNYIHLKLNNPQATKAGIIEVSRDGSSWERFNAKIKGDALENNLDVKRKIRFFRFVNNSAKPLEIKTNIFKFDVPNDAKSNSRETMTDGDPRSFFVVNSRETITSPKPGQKAYVISSAPDCVTVSPGKVDIAPKKGKPVKVFEIVWK